MSEVSYRLAVKSPDDRMPCLSVNCSSSWSVKQLKEHLSEIHSFHPSPSAQRLIHAGKLLKDDIMIKSLFKDPKEMQTVHLVCRNIYVTTQTKKAPVEEGTAAPSHVDLSPNELERYQREYYEYLQNFFMTNGDNTVATCQNSGTTGSTSVQPASQAFWYTHPAWGCMSPGTQSWPYWYHPAAYGYPPSMDHVPPASGGLPAEANTGAVNAAAVGGAGWIQGARAMLTGLAAGDAQAPDAVDGVQAEVQPQQAQQAPPQQAQQQQAMMVGNPMMGGFMGAEEFGEGGEHMDIVDRFYMLFRLCLFVGLCFAYSSLDKAIIVFSVAAYVYFYNIYRRHAAIRRAAAEAQQNRESAERPPANQSSGQPDQNNGTNATTEGSASGDTDPDQQLRQRVDSSNQLEESTGNAPSVTAPRMQRLTGTLRLVVSTSYQFFSSLLTSLIPEQPPPIRLE